MTKPGRNARGQFITNDATSGQAFDLLANALDDLAAAVEALAIIIDPTMAPDDVESEDEDERMMDAYDLITGTRKHIKAARDAAALADAGTRPGKESA